MIFFSVSRFYPMEKKCSGICLLFVTDSHKLNVVNRKDEKILRETFSYLRFHVIVKMNKNSDEILKIIEKKGFKHKNCDCFVVCVLCRNSENSTVDNQSELQIDSMARKVTNLSSLQHKPKLFFIQAWKTEPNQSSTNQHDINQPSMLIQNVWENKDIFYSIAQGNNLIYMRVCTDSFLRKATQISFILKYIN